MDIGWYLRRLRRMSPAEIGWRARSATLQRFWRIATPRAPEGRLQWTGVALARGAVDPAAGQRLVQAAEQVLAGRWSVFGRNFDTAPEDPDWHRDPRSGLRFDPACYCFDVPYRDPERVGNVKSVWEPSRLHHVTLLAAAWHLTRDERFARHAAAHLRSWWRRNPPLRGIHWLSGIELGMRLIAWVWTRRLLGDWPGVAALFEDNATFAEQLYHHQRWLAVFHSRGSSANNHLIAEAAGLFIAGTAFSGTAQQTRWTELAAGILELEALNQTFPDGLNRELAFGYHGYVLGLFLLAGIEGEAGGRPLSDDCWHAMTRMADALAANLQPDPDGTLQPPRQGDGDDAFALMIDDPAVGPWSPLLGFAAAVLEPRGWWPKPASPSVLATLAAPLGRGRRVADPRPAQRPNRFAEAGITFLCEATGGTAISCRVDHGPHGFLATTAHGHADALAFELWVGGRPVLVDPGTYCYQGEPDWRRYFRSTVAHNSLEVGGVDQAVQAGPFLWSTQPASWAVEVTGIDAGAIDADDAAELTVAHDGYLRLEAKVTHFRRYHLDRRDHRLAIADWIEAKAPVSVRLAFHLHPTVEVGLIGARASLSWEGGGGTLDLPADLAWTVHRGEDAPPLGWYSPEFGEKVPAATLIGRGILEPGARLETLFHLGAGQPPATASIEESDA